MLSYDIKVTGKKRVSSYFENYSKFLNKENERLIFEMIEKIQKEIINIYENSIRILGNESDITSILNNPDFDLSSLVNKDKQYLRNVDINSGDMLMYSMLHTIDTKGGGVTRAKNLNNYLNTPQLNDSDYASMNKADKFQLLQNVFKTFDINFSSLDQFKEKYAKLEAYSQISGDNALLYKVSSLIRSINTAKNKPLDKFNNLETYQFINDNKVKLKIIFRLKLDPRTIEMLKSYKLVQQGDRCMFIKDPQKDPIVLSDEALSALARYKTSSYKRRKALLKLINF